MDAYSILKMLWRIRKTAKRRGLIEAILQVFKPELDRISRKAMNAFENLDYLGYEAKSIEYDIENIQEMSENLAIEINNVKKSYNSFKSKMT